MHRFDPTLYALAAVLTILLTIAACGRDEQAREVADRARTADRDTTATAGLTADDDLGPPHLVAFACGEVEPYLAMYDLTEDAVTLLTPTEARVLSRVVAASGARYGDGRYTLWTKGRDEIMLEVDGQVRAGCEPSGRQRVITAAWQAGYFFRATGNEPFWTLMINDESIRLDRHDRPGAAFSGLAEGELAAGEGDLARQTTAHALRVIVEATPCFDTMSGEPSTHTVTIEVDDEVLHGCGIWLRPPTAAGSGS